jgi:hypothetical protein
MASIFKVGDRLAKNQQRQAASWAISELHPQRTVILWSKVGDSRTQNFAHVSLQVRGIACSSCCLHSSSALEVLGFAKQ